MPATVTPMPAASRVSDLVNVALPRDLVDRIIELNTRRDILASSDLALSGAGLPVDLDSPEHADLNDQAVEMFDDFSDLVEDALAEAGE